MDKHTPKNTSETQTPADAKCKKTHQWNTHVFLTNLGGHMIFINVLQIIVKTTGTQEELFRLWDTSSH